MTGVLITALLVFSAHLQNANAISGSVVHAATGAALAGATVELVREGEAGSVGPITVSAEDGTFIFERVPAGRYRLIATRAGYVRAEYGQQYIDGPGRIIDVANGESATGLRIVAPPTGTIYGGVYDDGGRPVERAPVELMIGVYRDGQRTLETVQRTYTDDLGQYRLFWLVPNLYYVRSRLPNRLEGNRYLLLSPAGSARSGGVTASEFNPDLQQPAAPFYYPGTADFHDAEPVRVGMGESLGPLNVRIGEVATQRVSVRGTVYDARSGVPVTAEVRLHDLALPAAGSVPITIARNGAFEIAGAPPGAYLMTARALAADNGIDAAGGTMTGRMVIEVRYADVEGIRIPVAAGVSVSGRIGIETSDGTVRRYEWADGTPLPGIGLVPSPALAGLARPRSAISPDGTFTFGGVPPGQYALDTQALENFLHANMPAAYLKSAFQGVNDVRTGELTVDGTANDLLELRIGTDGGQLGVRAVDASGEPVYGAFVMLVPTPSAPASFHLYRNSNSDALGQVRFQGIAPGEYELFAWEYIRPGEWQDPEFIRFWRGRGVRVTVAAGTSTGIEVVVTSAWR